MDSNLAQINNDVYFKCAFRITNLQIEKESREYDACGFELNGLNVLSRNAKITPKKVGQFVTFWKRIGKGPIEPFNEVDSIDFFIVNTRSEREFGQFVFPKSILIEKGIISTTEKEGKRAFRVYPIWDVVKNKQAERTQKWQLSYFYKINDSTDLHKVKQLYKQK